MAISDSDKTIPKGWIEVNLIDLLLSLESGSRPKGGVKGIKDGIPSIGAEHLNYTGGFHLDNIKYVPLDYAKKMIRGKIQLNDILIVKDGATTGKTALIGPLFPYFDAVVNEHVFICRPSNYIEPKYLFWFLWSETGQKRVMKNFKGSAQGGINTSFAYNTIIPLSPVNEQKRIIGVIENLVNKLTNIEEKSRQIEVLAEEAFNKFVSNSNQNYQTEKIGIFCTEQKSPIGKNWQNKRLIGVSNELGITDLRIGAKITFERYKVVNPGDFIYNPMRADIGSVAIWEGEDIALTSPDYIVFKIEHTISSNLLLKYLKSPLGLSQIKNNTQGSVRSRLYFENLAKIDFPFNGEEQQREAQIVLETFERIKRETKKIINKMQSVLQETLEKAYSGKLDTRSSLDENAEALLEKILSDKKSYLIRILKLEKMNQKKTKENIDVTGKSILKILSDAKEPIAAKILWEKSIYSKDIDSFYAELKRLIEIEKKIIEIKSGNDYYLKILHEN